MGERAIIDAWVDPPSFVRRPPIALATQGKVLHQDDMPVVAQGSRLIIRYHGDGPPDIAVHAYDKASRRILDRLDAGQLQRLEPGAWKFAMRLMQPVRVRVSGGVFASWSIDVRADLPPGGIL